MVVVGGVVVVGVCVVIVDVIYHRIAAVVAAAL